MEFRRVLFRSAPLQAERREAGGDGTGGDQHDLGAAGACGREHLDQGGQPVRIDSTRSRGQGRGADLAHDPACSGDLAARAHAWLSPDSLPSDAASGSDSFQSGRSEDPTSDLTSLMRISYAVFCLKKKTQ